MKRVTERSQAFIGAWVPKELKRKLQAIAKREGRSLGKQMEKFLAAGCNTPLRESGDSSSLS